MVELVDTLVLGTSAFGRQGSSPCCGTLIDFMIMISLIRNTILLPSLLSFILGLNLTLHDYDNPSASHILDADIIGDILIVTGMVGGIEFYNISNPETLNHLTSFNLSGGGGGGGSKPNCVKALGDYAYITTKNGVAILNISNPSNPQSLGYVSGTSNRILENLDILNNTLAVAAHEDGVLVYDLSNQTSPQLTTTLEAENAWTVHLTDNYIYVGDESTLFIYDTEYAYISSLELPNSIKDIKTDDNYIYVAIGTDGVMALNLITDDEAPNIIDTYNTTSLANRLDLLDSKVAVSDWDDVEILQVNGQTLEKVGYKNTTRRTMAIATKENYIYSAEWATVQIFEFGEVEGADIDLSAYELNYPFVEDGESYTLSLDVTNNGNSTFILNEAYVTNDEFLPSNLENLNPGETQTIDIIYTADADNASGSYRIYSNDPDEPEVLCETNGNIIGANVGDQGPDFDLNIVANGNGSFQLSDHIGEVIVLAFFAPNWPVCSPELSDFETSIWQEFDQEVIVLGIINTSNQGQIDQFVAENSLTFPIVYDPGSPGGVQGGDTYDLYFMPNDGSPYPRDFIIDQEGIIQYANNEIDTDWMISIIEDLIFDSNLTLGDLNFDGIINILDIVSLVNIVLGLTENPTEDMLYVADINQDQSINVLDIVLTVNIVLNP